MKCHAMLAAITTTILIIYNYKTWGSEKPNHCSRSGSERDHFFYSNSIICPSFKLSFSFESRKSWWWPIMNVLNTTEMHTFKW